MHRMCYPAIRHRKHGDTIFVKDCVLLRPTLPLERSYVAKVAAFWQHANAGACALLSRRVFASCTPWPRVGRARATGRGRAYGTERTRLLRSGVR